MKECGVFGVSSAEYLNYALANRREWEERGEEVVAEMVRNVERKSVGDKLLHIQQEMVDQEGEKIIAGMRKASMNMTKQDLPVEISTRNLKDKPLSDPPTVDSEHSEVDEDYEVPLREED